MCLENSSGEQQSVADAFAGYFARIGRKLADSIPSTPHDADIVLDTVDWNEHSIFLSPATQEEILLLIGAVQSKKAAGIDGIHPLVIKNYAQTIAPALTEIINNCISIFKKKSFFFRSSHECPNNGFRTCVFLFVLLTNKLIHIYIIEIIRAGRRTFDRYIPRYRCTCMSTYSYWQEILMNQHHNFLSSVKCR